MKRATFHLLGGLVLSLAAEQVMAQSEACQALVGTYLTKKIDRSGPDAGVTGRTLISIDADGGIFISDSAQGGIENYQAFSLQHGQWDCTLQADGTVVLGAMLLDFTYPNAAEPDAKIARVDMAATLDADTGTLTGTSRVNIFTLMDDPISGTAPEMVIEFDFEGERVNLDGKVSQ